VEALFERLAGGVALALEGVAVLLIVIGAATAVTSIAAAVWRQRWAYRSLKHAWARLGVWLLLGLEFMLAADVVRTAISPSWDDLGQLATIAVIRTFLNYFLEKDVERAIARGDRSPADPLATSL
jgi:uncharacterized membrane protein